MGHGQKRWPRSSTPAKGVREVRGLALDAITVLLPLILH